MRDDDDASAGTIAGTSPDVMGMFWMPERDSCVPAELEPEGRDAEGSVMGSDVRPNTSIVGWEATAGRAAGCGNPLKLAD